MAEKREAAGDAAAPKRRRKAAAEARDAEPREETEYYFENGLRKVRPYEFQYKANCKGRWFGRTLLDVFEREFADMSRDYYVSAIESGLITINDKRVPTTYVIRNGDVLRHRIFRHEPPVSAEPLHVIAQTDEMLVINKPGSMPVHPSGRYRHNTVQYILRREVLQEELYPMHRLDRLTSGVLLMARTKERAQAMQQQMRDKEFVKEYLCRVRGEFPEAEIDVDKPIKTTDFKLGLNAVALDGKECRTVFKRLSFNGKTSLVHARPYTGRTHQIRVHLQYLGHPIANDPLYCHGAWGPDLGKGGVTPEQLVEIVRKFRTGRVQNDVAHKEYEDKLAAQGQTLPDGYATASSSASSTASSTGTDPRPPRLVNLKRDPLPHELCLWLHACKYSGPDWSYEAPSPAWAATDFDGDAWLQDAEAVARLSENLFMFDDTAAAASEDPLQEL